MTLQSQVKIIFLVPTMMVDPGLKSVIPLKSQDPKTQRDNSLQPIVCYRSQNAINWVMYFLRVHAKSTSVMSDSLRPYGLQFSRFLCPWDSPGKNTGACCHALLQGIFPTQESNRCLLCILHCRWILYLLSHQGSPAICLVWANFGFARPGI